jgi:hypothetical protein
MSQTDSRHQGQMRTRRLRKRNRLLDGRGDLAIEGFKHTQIVAWHGILLEDEALYKKRTSFDLRYVKKKAAVSLC